MPESSEDLPDNSRVPWNSEFLERHHLQGHIYSRTQNKTFYPYWKSQLTRNSFAKKELDLIGQDLEKEGVQTFLLKGFSLMGEIYQDWGERYVSDIDLLVSFDELWKLADILKMYGYEKVKVKKWLANRHVHCFRKKNGESEFSIEVHTQLFWHTSLDSGVDTQPSSMPGFQRLSVENQLIHLCGHVAFQNSFSHLHWLVDIYKYVDSHRDKINWKEFWRQAELCGLYKSCYFTLFLCQKLGLNLHTVFFRAKKQKRVGIYFLRKIVNYSYLYNPESHVVKKAMVRLLIADSVSDSIRYFWSWMKTFKMRRL